MTVDSRFPADDGLGNVFATMPVVGVGRACDGTAKTLQLRGFIAGAARSYGVNWVGAQTGATEYFIGD